MLGFPDYQLVEGAGFSINLLSALVEGAGFSTDYQVTIVVYPAIEESHYIIHLCIHQYQTFRKGFLSPLHC